MDQNDRYTLTELERHGIESSYIQYINGEMVPAVDLEYVREIGLAVRGERVRFLNENGYDIQRERAADIFNTKQLLTVDTLTVGRSSSTYTFYGYAGSFNTVMFEKEKI